MWSNCSISKGYFKTFPNSTKETGTQIFVYFFGTMAQNHGAVINLTRSLSQSPFCPVDPVCPAGPLIPCAPLCPSGPLDPRITKSFIN